MTLRVEFLRVLRSGLAVPLTGMFSFVRVESTFRLLRVGAEVVGSVVVKFELDESTVVEFELSDSSSVEFERCELGLVEFEAVELPECSGRFTNTLSWSRSSKLMPCRNLSLSDASFLSLSGFAH